MQPFAPWYEELAQLVQELRPKYHSLTPAQRQMYDKIAELVAELHKQSLERLSKDGEIQRQDAMFRVESTPEDELEARVNALALEGWDPVSVWRAGKTGMLQVIFRRSEKPRAQKAE